MAVVLMRDRASETIFCTERARKRVGRYLFTPSFRQAVNHVLRFVEHCVFGKLRVSFVRNVNRVGISLKVVSLQWTRVVVDIDSDQVVEGYAHLRQSKIND